MVVYLLFALTIIVFFMAFSLMKIQQTNDIQGIHGVVKGEQALNNFLNYETIDKVTGEKVTIAYLLSNIDLYEDDTYIKEVYHKNAEYTFRAFIQDASQNVAYTQTNMETGIRLKLTRIESDGKEDYLGDYTITMAENLAGNDFDHWKRLYHQNDWGIYRNYKRYIPIVKSNEVKYLLVDLEVIDMVWNEEDKDIADGSDRKGVT